jgi:predicted ATP-grasp superfamily ATP-dependent carboligase
MSTPGRGRPPSAGRGGLFEGIDTSTPVVLLTAAPGARLVRQHAALGIERSLGRLGIPVHLVDTNPRGTPASSRYRRRRFLFDLAGASPEATVDHLLRVGRRLGGRPVLIPTWDDLAVVVAEAGPVLREQFLLPPQPIGLARALSGKWDMHRLAAEHGVPSPQVAFPKTSEDVEAFAAEATFPVMIKANVGSRLNAQAGQALFRADSRDQLLRLCRELEDAAEPNLLLQEYIPGGDDAVWMFNGYFGDDSECLFGLTGRKLRQTPPRAGTTSLGVCLPNETVDQVTRRWMKAMGYRGMLDLGFRYDSRDGQYKILDVNPRIGSSFRLFVGRGGLDVVRAAYLHLTGQVVPPDAMDVGRRWMDEKDLGSAWADMRAGNLTVRQWATSLRDVRETALAALDDPVPAVELARLALGRRLRRIAD